MIPVLILTFVTVSVCVIFHYEVLVFLSYLARTRQFGLRRGVVIGVFGMLFAHVVEIMLFGVGYRLMHGAEQYGRLIADEVMQREDFFYYSFTVYTTLGFGDILPQGNIRMLTIMESLTGLVLIAWTASYLFVQMQHQWQRK